MKVCKCDRCGRIFEPIYEDSAFRSPVVQIGMETFGLEDTEANIIDTFDICDDCYNDFQRWMKRGRIKNNG